MYWKLQVCAVLATLSVTLLCGECNHYESQDYNSYLRSRDQSADRASVVEQLLEKMLAEQIAEQQSQKVKASEASYENNRASEMYKVFERLGNMISSSKEQSDQQDSIWPGLSEQLADQPQTTSKVFTINPTTNPTETPTSTPLDLYDTPLCGYGVRVCECNESASVCAMNLEIDEIMTFTSYRKFGVPLGEGLAVRGTQGVVYNIDEDTGEAGPHPFYEGRHCADPNNKENCSEPQFVDGMTYRMAIGVNGQIPGPTLIVHENQTVIIHVHNNLSTEGISIHWHGMHQIGTPWMDGVGQVTQCQIGPSSSYTYKYVAKPSGTFWYHSHSGAQRTDGFFGTLVVKESKERMENVTKELEDKGIPSFEDHPDRHSLILLDWDQESALENFAQLGASLGFFPGVPVGRVPTDCDKRYGATRGVDGSGIGPVPYFSGLINGKGRHEDIPYSQTRLSVFTVTKGQRYRFRLIGAQGLYAYKFSIDGHRLTVVGTDGYWIQPEEDTDYIIIHTGERYDFILDADQEVKEYWIRAETLEINPKGGPPYRSLGHVAEGILQYVNPKDEGNPPEIKSTSYEEIKLSSPLRECTCDNMCNVINCPFEKFHPKYNMKCKNVQELKLLEATPANEMPKANPTCIENCTHFINFNFEGDSETSSVNGRNFILPPVPPQTQNEAFYEQANICDLTLDCNPSGLDCMCTHEITIPGDETIQFILSAVGRYDTTHPIHLHGHTFHVVEIGYPDYDIDPDVGTGYISKEDGPFCYNKSTTVSAHNDNIECGDLELCGDGPECPKVDGCQPSRCTMPGWSKKKSNQARLDPLDPFTIRKDTVMVPAGGYVVINFLSNNPGYWFMHCHIEVHQLEGMALIVNEDPDHQPDPPDYLNKCGDVNQFLNNLQE